MACIKISIIDKGKESLTWHSSDMDEFMCGVVIRAMASAVEKPVVEAVLDSVIARIVLADGNIKTVCKKVGVSKSGFYRGLKNAS